MFHCFDHEIVLEGMKEEISQQRGTIGAHWYTNNLPENRAPKTNVDVVDKTIAGLFYITIDTHYFLSSDYWKLFGL